ncbi:stage II sporulation protein P [Massilistercora timonensis]|uniref:stage II sporulation protein P n=1 Tax=Massilistercora timonensis TaxID=2086584 RepID=UPI003208F050
MELFQRRVSQVLMVLVLGILILYAGFHIKIRLPEEVRLEINRFLGHRTEEMYLAGFAYCRDGEAVTPSRWVLRAAGDLMPLERYIEEKEPTDVAVEDRETYEMILARQAGDENKADEAVQTDGTAKKPDISLEKLKDFDYLMGHFYTVDSSTSVDPEQLNAQTLLGKDLTIDQSGEGPKVLIYHTHSQEAFADSRKGEERDTIVGVGEYLAQLLNETYQIPTLHHKGVYDLIDGKLDRSRAYELALPEVEKILKENPSIEVVIDLHRDGVGDSTHLVEEINGKPTAQIMFFNGMSRTKANGPIEYLKNPYIEDNLAFSLQMQLAAQKYPGFTRRIYLKSYRYNMHVTPKTLLVEAGAQTNTVEEMRNAMEILAETLDTVLTP